MNRLDKSKTLHFLLVSLEKSDALSQSRISSIIPAPVLHGLQPLLPELYRIAFEERLKIHDVVLEGIDLALRRRMARKVCV